MGKEFSKDFSLLLCSTQTQDNFKKEQRDLGCSFIDPNYIQENLLIVIILIHEGTGCPKKKSSLGMFLSCQNMGIFWLLSTSMPKPGV